MRVNRPDESMLPWTVLPMLLVAGGTIFLYKGVWEALLVCAEDLTRRRSH